jgi:hypothetical protein
MKAPPTRVIFVDATLPPASGGVPLVPEELLASLRALARNGRLPKWSEWFGPGTIEALVPDPGRRAVVLEDLPEIPLSYFDERIPVPAGWVNADGAYILLSDPYRSDAAEAASRGWPVRELPGSHLDIVTRASDVSDALVELTQP